MHFSTGINGRTGGHYVELTLCPKSCYRFDIFVALPIFHLIWPSALSNTGPQPTPISWVTDYFYISQRKFLNVTFLFLMMEEKHCQQNIVLKLVCCIWRDLFQFTAIDLFNYRNQQKISYKITVLQLNGRLLFWGILEIQRGSKLSYPRFSGCIGCIIGHHRSPCLWSNHYGTEIMITCLHV